MAGNRQILIDALIAADNAVKDFDGESQGQSQHDASVKKAEIIGEGIDNYIQSIIFAATQDDVVSATMVASGPGSYPVTATNILKVKATEL